MSIALASLKAEAAPTAEPQAALQRAIPPQHDPLLMTEEAARHVRLSPRSLERLRVSGEGPRFLKAGPGKRARVLYRRSDLDHWLQQYSFTSTSEYARNAGDNSTDQ